jgi:hypothetical protein
MTQDHRLLADWAIYPTLFNPSSTRMLVAKLALNLPSPPTFFCGKLERPNLFSL